VGATPTAAAATDYIPVRSVTPLDNIKYLDDTGWRGSMVDVFNVVQGPISSEFAYTGDLFPDTFGYPIMGLLGDYAITGAASPYTHTGAVLNTSTGQATSYSYTDYYSMSGASSARQYAGCQLESVDVKFNADGMLEYDAKALGFASTTVTNPTPSFSTVLPLPSWTGNFAFGTGTATQVTNKAQTTTTATLTTSSNHGIAVGATFTVANVGAPFDGTFVAIAGTATTSLVYTVGTTATVTSTAVSPNGFAAPTVGILQSGNIGLKRTVTPIFTVQGLQRPYQVFQGPLQVEGALTLIMEDDTHLTSYLNNTQPGLDLNFTNGTGTSLLGVQFHMNKAAYKVAKIERGKEYIEVTVNFKAIGNLNDAGASAGYSPVKTTLRNAKATAVYA
jgi:hypothetical protein